jgi:hypothetical protein
MEENAMRLHPAVSEKEALDFLKNQAVLLWGKESALELEDALKSLADAMASVSSIKLPDDVEPAFSRPVIT